MPRKQHDFVMSDERVNRYGFRVLTEGIDLSEFNLNPIALDDHNRSSRTIGKWENLRKQEGKLIGTLLYNEDNPRAIEIYNDVENGYQSAVSIGFRVVEKSDDTALLLAGQRFATVTKAMLIECSPTNIPANGGAVKLYDDGSEVVNLSMLSITPDETHLQTPNPKKLMDKLKTAFLSLAMVLNMQLALADLSDEADMERALKTLGDEFETQLSDKDDEIAQLKKERNEAILLKYAEVIKEEQKEFYLNSLQNNYEGTLKMLESLSVSESQKDEHSDQPDFNNFFKNGEGKNATTKEADKKLSDRSEWTMLDWMKKDMQSLDKLKLENPEAYQKLANV